MQVDSVDWAPPNDAPVDDGFFTAEDLERIWAVQLAPERVDVVAYTQDHIDEFAGRWWEDNTVLVLAFTGHVEEHGPPSSSCGRTRFVSPRPATPSKSLRARRCPSR